MTQNGHHEGASIPAGKLAGDGRNILSVEKLTIAFDGFTVLDNLDFSIGYGAVSYTHLTLPTKA